ncbi:MAG TPA: hypothetical protein VN921_01465 [Chthoniobacterales bacterium]|nr:hypothetical protein [Chthoniobacterales bacterium]
MARNLTAAQIAEITAQNLRPVMFVQALFTSGYIYVWSGQGPISWNGQTWTGVGSLGSVSTLPETADVTAVGIKLSLSGIPASLITSALGEVRQGNPVIIYQGFLTPAGGVVVSPNNAWQGRMDTCEIAEGGDTAVISITAESRMLDLNRSRERRYEKQDQAIDYPTDLGFDYVASLQELSIVWGKATPSSAPVHPGGGGFVGGRGAGGGAGRLR